MLDFQNRVAKRHRHLRRQAAKEKTNVFRVYDHDIPGRPFALDVAEDAAVLHAFPPWKEWDEAAGAEWLGSAREAVQNALRLPPEDLFVKLRRRRPGTNPYAPLDRRGVERIGVEGSLRFWLNLSDYIDIGIFPNQRLLRGMVMERAHGLSVLNLFAYTGGFSVAAAKGEARRIVTVDLSNTYLAWTKRNFDLNGIPLSPRRHAFVRADALEWLKREPEEAFDLILLDPPSFSNSKGMASTFDVQRDHAGLIRSALRHLTLRGTLIFSTGRRGFLLDEKALSDLAMNDLTTTTVPFDFLGRTPHQTFAFQRRVP